MHLRCVRRVIVIRKSQKSNLREWSSEKNLSVVSVLSVLNIKMNTFEKIFALLRSELWGEPLACEVTAEDIDGILAMAEMQGVSGLVANAIISSNLPIGDVKTVDVCTVTRLHELKCRDMNKMVARFAGFLNRRELKYVVMKGQTMAALYPHPLMRSCGDIDFYCPKESFEDAKKEIESRLKLKMDAWDDTKHLQFKRGEVVFEMHSALTVFGSRKHQRYWDAMIKDEKMDAVVTIDGTEVKILSPTIYALYLFVHLFGHFIIEGVSLKQLCDLSVFLQKKKDGIDKDSLMGYLKGVGLDKAFMIWGNWLVEKIGLPAEAFPFELPAEGRLWEKKLTDSITDKFRLGEHEKREKGGKANFSILLKRTIWVARQVTKFYRLAPREIIGKFFEMASRQVRLRS